MIKISLILLTLLSLWVTRDLFRPEFFQSHDALYHVVRLDQFHKALLAGQFPVRWAPDLLNGLGYPLFIVNYHLPYYLAEAFHLLGLSLFSAIKAVFIVSLTASALTSFWLFYSWTKSNLAATLGSLFFILAPYRLANIFERGALGEAVAYVFVPLIFLGFDHLKRNRSIKLLSFSLASLILSHTIVAIIFTPVFLGYLFISGYTKRHLLPLVKSLILSFGLSAFQLFPVIFERHYLKFDANLLMAYQGHFKSLYQLFRIPHAGVNIGTRFQVGLAHLLIVLVSFTRGRLARFFLVAFLISIFLITPASQFLWDNLPPLQMVLYPWRFLGVAAFTTSALTALFIASPVGRRVGLYGVAGFLLLFLLFTTRHYVKVDVFIPPVFPQQLLAGNATTQNEFDPISPDKLGSPGRETPIREAGNWLSLFSFLIWFLL